MHADGQAATAMTATHCPDTPPRSSLGLQFKHPMELTVVQSRRQRELPSLHFGMSPAAVQEYVAGLLAKADEDAFHSLIEEGNQAVAAVGVVLPTCSKEQFKRLIEVLQDIRTEHSRATLAMLCKQPYSELWVMAAEGLFYNDPTAARSVLAAIVAEANEREEWKKSALIEDLLSTGFLPAPTRSGGPRVVDEGTFL